MKSDIILAGVGGQGILSIATVLGYASVKENLYIKQSEVHGMSQRGGDVQSNLRISSSPIHSDLISLGSADLIISLEPMEALRYIPYLSNEGWIITNEEPFVNIDNYPEISLISKELHEAGKTVMFNMDRMAKEIGAPRSSNMILLGAASPFIDIPVISLEEGIEKVFKNKGEKIITDNITAFRAGRDVSLKIKA